MSHASSAQRDGQELTAPACGAGPAIRAGAGNWAPSGESARLWLHVMETLSVAAFAANLPGQLAAAGVGRPERFAAMSIRQRFAGPPAGSLTVSASRTLLEAMESHEREPRLRRVLEQICQRHLARVGAPAEAGAPPEVELIAPRMVGDDAGRTSSVVVRSSAGWMEVSLGFDTPAQRGGCPQLE